REKLTDYIRNKLDEQKCTPITLHLLGEYVRYLVPTHSSLEENVSPVFRPILAIQSLKPQAACPTRHSTSDSQTHTSSSPSHTSLLLSACASPATLSRDPHNSHHANPPPSYSCTWHR